MKRYLRLIVVMLALFGFAIYLSRPQSPRQRVLNTWIRDTEQFVRTHNDQRGKELLRFLKEHGRLEAPIPDRTGLLKTMKRTDGKFALTPLLTEDQRVEGPWSYFLSNQQIGAAYLSPLHILILKPEKLSRDTRALALLHELEHTWNDQILHFDPLDTEVAVEEERVIYLQDAQRMTRTWGKSYTDLVEREMRRLKTTRKSRYSSPRPTGYYWQMEAMLGPSNSEYERQLRTSQIWIHATLRLIAQEQPVHKREETQRSFIRGLLQAVGATVNI